MRAYFIILFSFISLTAVGQDKVSTPSVTANFDSIGIWGKIYTTVTISNNTKDTIRYYSMSCSYNHFFVCDNKEIIIPGVPCDSNAYIIITLAPHQSDIRKLELKSIPEWKKLESIKFRIGLRYTHPLKNGGWLIISDIKKGIIESNSSEEIILWSNELTITGKKIMK